ncbi:DUF397 domain-containing protein (plasmid) [Streptomyces albidoflavus]|uniref:DUF397 domain-containing protein n=1 Tax=Streptomyces albidoflavus TaxID=1886 RepID=UPI002F9146BF|nr:DUF397 domain-containing protein [Streptomyces albidoflavus]WTD07633.1 DUF397 domain-containing protein [Streptomyces albidoflavus]
MTTRPTPDFAAAVWRTSTYSAANNECVAVAASPGMTWVGVRDTKTLGGPVLAVSPSAWSDMVAAVQAERI